MQVKATYHDIWHLAYPIMLGAIAQTILGLTDTAFLARVGEVELGASAIAGVYYFVLVMLGMALSIGSQILMSRKAGEGNRAAIGNIFDHSIIILLSMSVILFAIMHYVTPLLFGRILHSPEIAEASNTFIRYRSFGIFFILPVNCFRAFYTSISTTRYITYSSLVLTVSNIILDYVLIFGKLGFEAQGIAGAAKASSLAEAIACIFLFLLTAFKKDIKSFRLFRFQSISFSTIKQVLIISAPILFQNLLSMGAWFLFFVFIEQLGEHELAISNIVRSAYMVLMTPVWGFSSAANSMVSNLIGQNKPDEIFKLIKKIITLSLLTVAGVFLLNLIDIRFLLRIMTSDQKLIEDCMQPYYVIWCGMLFFSVSMILLNSISGTGKTQVALMIEILNIFIYLSYAYLAAIVFKTKLEVVWYVEVLYWITMGLCAWLYLRSNKWRNTKSLYTQD
jgi:putative MATE family efflux protein